MLYCKPAGAVWVEIVVHKDIIFISFTILIVKLLYVIV
jgi:hypothetical protein